MCLWAVNHQFNILFSNIKLLSLNAPKGWFYHVKFQEFTWNLVWIVAHMLGSFLLFNQFIESNLLNISAMLFIFRWIGVFVWNFSCNSKAYNSVSIQSRTNCIPSPLIICFGQLNWNHVAWDFTLNGIRFCLLLFN